VTKGSQDAPNIIDVTISKGGALVHNNLLEEQVGEIAKGLNEAGIRYMEVSHARGIGAKKAGYPGLVGDRDLLRAARLQAPGLRYTAYLSPYPYSLLEAEKVAEFCDYLRLSIELEDVDKAVASLKNLKSARKPVIAMMERIHRLSPSQVLEYSTRLQDEGAEVIYLCDSFGSMTPEDLRSYLEPLAASLEVPLGFQGFNTTGQASANTLVALDHGVKWIDSSLLGLGVSGGMTSTEILISLLRQKNQSKNLNLRTACQTARWFARPTMRHLPRATAIDLALAEHKLDYYPTELLGILSSILEIDIDAMLTALADSRPGLLRLKENDIRILLEGHSLDFDVVMEYIKTGKVPEAEAAQ